MLVLKVCECVCVLIDFSNAAIELCFSAKSMSSLILMNIISSIHCLNQK